MFFKIYIPLHSRLSKQCDFQNLSKLMCHGVCLENQTNEFKEALELNLETPSSPNGIIHVITSKTSSKTTTCLSIELLEKQSKAYARTAPAPAPTMHLLFLSLSLLQTLIFPTNSGPSCFDSCQ